jgi:carboxyl-terminal processing protease
MERMPARPLSRRSTLLIGATLILSTIAGGAFGERATRSDEVMQSKLREYTELLDATRTWAAEDPGDDKLVYSSVRGMLATLDPHTYFLEPAGYHQMREKDSGSYYGIGCLVTQRNGHLTVITPFDGSPAARLGLRAGDMITQIDGVATDGLAYNDAVKRLKGPKGTQVQIQIVRSGMEQPIPLTVTRASIPTNSVATALMLTPDTGYIRISDFTSTTAREFDDAVIKLSAAGMKKIVLDLRGNPGGSLDAALEVADHFLQKGDLIVFTKGRTHDSQQQYLAAGNHAQIDVPAVVMVDHGSASASEIVAGAIQDHDRGLVVGQVSWGKGLVQGVYNLQYGAGLALTTARYYTPSGRNIQRDYSSLYDYYVETAPADRPEADRKAFTTTTGRIVYGGGGITPDVTIKGRELSRITQLIEARGVLFDYGVAYFAAHPELDKSVTVTPEMIAALEKKAVEKELGTKSEVEAALAQPADRNFIEKRMRAEIIAARYGFDASYSDRVAADDEIARATELLPEAARLAQSASKLRNEKMAAAPSTRASRN